MNLAPRQIHAATRADLEALPPSWRGEIIDGDVYAFPRPGAPHAHAVLGGEQTVRAEPFEAVDIPLGAWWEGFGE